MKSGEAAVRFSRRHFRIAQPHKRGNVLKAEKLSNGVSGLQKFLISEETGGFF